MKWQTHKIDDFKFRDRRMDIRAAESGTVTVCVWLFAFIYFSELVVSHPTCAYTLQIRKILNCESRYLFSTLPFRRRFFYTDCTHSIL